MAKTTKKTETLKDELEEVSPTQNETTEKKEEKVLNPDRFLDLLKLFKELRTLMI